MTTKEKINRYTDWFIVYSPQLKSEINIDLIDNFEKLLKKNTIKYSMSYEEGSNSNPHLDIVCHFNSKQSRGDIIRKLSKFISNTKKPALDVGKINDWFYRLAYNLKENLTFPFPIGDAQLSTGIQDAEIESAIKHYKQVEEERSEMKNIKYTFKYINVKQALYTINRYCVENKIICKSKEHLRWVLQQLYKEGYMFDLNTNQKRMVISNYLAWSNKDTFFIEEEIDDWFEEPIYATLPELLS